MGIDNFDNLNGSNNSLNKDNYNFFNASGSGLYQIICKKNKKRYIGESENVLARLATHLTNLRNGVSDCYELQTDFNRYGISEFEANIIEIGPSFEDRLIRLKREKEIIISFDPEEVYNSHPNKLVVKVDNYRISCKINNIIYRSVVDASRQTGESERQIRNKLHYNVPNYCIIEKIRSGYESIIVNDKVYDSITDAVNAGEAKNRYQAMRFLKSMKNKNWNYISIDKKIDK
jgi:group I intron endonuclease